MSGGRWFRVYDSLVEDPKVQRLPGETFKGLVNLWCIASRSGGFLPSAADIAFTLRMKPERVDKLLGDLRAAGLIDDDDAGPHPHNWRGRQFKSDGSSNRVRAFRERQRNGDGNVSSAVTETPPDTDTDSEPEVAKKGPIQGFGDDEGEVVRLAAVNGRGR